MSSMDMGVVAAPVGVAAGAAIIVPLAIGGGIIAGTYMGIKKTVNKITEIRERVQRDRIKRNNDQANALLKSFRPEIITDYVLDKVEKNSAIMNEMYKNASLSLKDTLCAEVDFSNFRKYSEQKYNEVWRYIDEKRSDFNNVQNELSVLINQNKNNLDAQRIAIYSQIDRYKSDQEQLKKTYKKNAMEMIELIDALIEERKIFFLDIPGGEAVINNYSESLEIQRINYENQRYLDVITGLNDLQLSIEGSTQKYCTSFIQREGILSEIDYKIRMIETYLYEDIIIPEKNTEDFYSIDRLKELKIITDIAKGTTSQGYCSYKLEMIHGIDKEQYRKLQKELTELKRKIENRGRDLSYVQLSDLNRDFSLLLEESRNLQSDGVLAAIHDVISTRTAESVKCMLIENGFSINESECYRHDENPEILTQEYVNECGEVIRITFKPDYNNDLLNKQREGKTIIEVEKEDVSDEVSSEMLESFQSVVSSEIGRAGCDSGKFELRCLDNN